MFVLSSIVFKSNDIVGRLKLCSLDENNSKEPKIIGIATTTATSNANCELFKSGH